MKWVPEKLESVRNIPPPRNPKEVKRFPGLVRYYRKFVTHFADVARHTVFKWTSQFVMTVTHERTYTTVPILNTEYTPFTDASRYVWSCVLTQGIEHEIAGKMSVFQNPITYQISFFKVSPFTIKFEYIKGIKNTLGDMMSSFIELKPKI